MVNGTELFQSVNVSISHNNHYLSKLFIVFLRVFSDAKCVSLPDDKVGGLAVIRPDEGSVLVAFKDNVTLTCSSMGRSLRNTATSSFRQCVYDPKPGLPDYWLSGSQPNCPRADCGMPTPTPGAEYGQFVDTKYQSSFFFGCQNTFKLAGETEKHDNVVRCQSNGIWDFGDLRCEGPVCDDPMRPPDGTQIARSYEQGTLLFIFQDFSSVLSYII